MSIDTLILGAGGQLARALQAQLGNRSLAVGIDSVNLLEPVFLKTLEHLHQQYGFSVVYNAAAYTQVDNAEKPEEQSIALRVNGEAVGELAEWCAAHGVLLVHYSTDYVLDGSGDAPHMEDETPQPLNIYGHTKLDGERRVMSSAADHLIFRTSWLYDAHGKNFFNTMLKLMSERETLRVVSDQYGAPTYVPHLAEASIQAVEHARSMQTFPSGVYHLCSAGHTSWHGFAQAIHTQALHHGQTLACGAVEPIATNDYPTPAMRPRNSRLDCSKAMRILRVSLPHWEEGLRACAHEHYADHRM